VFELDDEWKILFGDEWKILLIKEMFFAETFPSV